MSQQPTGRGHSVHEIKATDNARVHVGDVHNHHEASSALLRDNIVRWLDAPSSVSSHDNARSRFTQGTGRWLLDSAAYEAWHSGKTPMVWITGKAGCCKTVLCSTVIDDVFTRTKGNVDIAFAYFYFAFFDHKRQSYRSLLLSLVCQLLECQYETDVDVPTTLRAAYEKRYRSTEILEGALLALLQPMTKTYIVIDAVDECPEDDDARSRLLQGLKTLSSVGPYVRLLFTSRREADIVESMQHEFISEIPIEDYAVDQYVAIYVSDQVAKHAKLASMDATVGGDIQRVLIKKSGGMFRWVYCQLEQIKRLRMGIRKETSIRQALHDLPRTLDETYERILSNIEGPFAEDVKRALEWMAFSARPLHYAELIEVCITRTEADLYVNEAEREVYSDMVTLLPSLIQITEKTGNYDVRSVSSSIDSFSLHLASEPTITLAHFSVKEYLVSHRIKNSTVGHFALLAPQAYYNMAQVCLAYMLHATTNTVSEDAHLDGSDDEAHMILLLDDLEDAFPFLERAGTDWPHFQRKAELNLPRDAVYGLQMQLLQDPSPHGQYRRRLMYRLFHAVLQRAGRADYSKLLSGNSALQSACALRLPATTAILCELEPDDIDREGENGETPLITACRNGDTVTVTGLLNAGANVDLISHKRSPLSIAAGKVHSGIADNIRILGAVADIDLGASGRSALAEATCGGHLAVVELLLRRGASIKPVADCDWDLLAIAADGDYVEIAQLLIAAGCDVDGSKNCRAWRSPVFVAAHKNARGVMRLLLDAGAKLDVEDPHGNTALHAACHGGFTKSVVDLLEAGADPNVRARGCDGLSNCSEWLSEDVDVVSMSAYRMAFLHRKYDVMALLISRGADLTLDFSDQRCPLHHLLVIDVPEKLASRRILNTVEALLRRYPEAALELPPVCVHDMDLFTLLQSHGANNVIHHRPKSDGSWAPCIGRDLLEEPSEIASSQDDSENIEDIRHTWSDGELWDQDWLSEEKDRAYRLITHSP